MISSDRLSAARKSFSNTTQITEKPKSPVKIARKMSLVSLKDKPGTFSKLYFTDFWLYYYQNNKYNILYNLYRIKVKLQQKLPEVPTIPSGVFGGLLPKFKTRE